MQKKKRKKQLPTQDSGAHKDRAKSPGLLEMLDFLDIKKSSFQKTFGVRAESLDILETELPICFWAHDECHTIVYANRLFLERHGNYLKKTCYRSIMGEEKVCNCCQSERALRVHEPQICKLCKRSKSGCEVNTFHWPITNRYGNTFMLKSSFHIDYSATIFEDVYMKEPIERSSHEILISCSACHRIKDREGNWVRADTEILDRYSGRISHGICPECVTLLYPHLRDSLDYTDK